MFFETPCIIICIIVIIILIIFEVIINLHYQRISAQRSSLGGVVTRQTGTGGADRPGGGAALAQHCHRVPRPGQGRYTRLVVWRISLTDGADPVSQ